MRVVFPEGVAVFFRLMGQDNMLARSVHLNARWVGTEDELDYVVRGTKDEVLGIFPRDFVSAILPLETTGPGVQADANNPSFKPAH